MPAPVTPIFATTDLEALLQHVGRVVVFAESGAELPVAAQHLNKLTLGAVERLVASDAFKIEKTGAGIELKFPSGMAAESVQVIRLTGGASMTEARHAGVSIAKVHGTADVLILADKLPHQAALAQGVALRAYRYTAQKSSQPDAFGAVTIMCADPDASRDASVDALAVAEGVHFTRDLVNAPANILTTETFAAELEAMRALGLEVEVLDEPELEALGMRALLAVGHGSECPSKVVVMRWNGGGDEAPFAVIGKGVMFDTGGISIKPAAGMEEMTMDMGGSAVTAGLMRTLALRKARANVVGVVGLAENMPDGRAQRPGDVVTSMKGDTIEVINTDAEGRLVLCDVMWYAQERFAPVAMIDLATLTGAIIVGLGHEKAGVFSNNDALANAFLAAAGDMSEGAWRMPLDPEYDELLKSRIADVKNVGGRTAGAITAAQFLQRFVKPETPWIHLDIAGVALVQKDTAHAPKGATGWGVMALDALVRARFEAK
jgi:leucyl aminopeptidase